MGNFVVVNVRQPAMLTIRSGQFHNFLLLALFHILTTLLFFASTVNLKREKQRKEMKTKKILFYDYKREEGRENEKNEREVRKSSAGRGHLGEIHKFQGFESE